MVAARFAGVGHGAAARCAAAPFSLRGSSSFATLFPMKLLVQRVTEASVSIEGSVRAAIGRGYMVLVGCRTGDTVADVDYLADRLAGLRVFCDEAGKMNRSVVDIGGSVLLVSQFTLYADTKKGNRPSFLLSGDPAAAKALFDRFCEAMRARLSPERVGTGVFAADMQVALVNDGPVTIELCSDAKFPKGE